MSKQKALLIVNVGTPDKPEKRHVKKFLTQFLNDPKVIDIPWLARKILVNFFIIPFRTSKSTKRYKQLWTKDGSPLLIHLNDVVTKLNSSLSDYDVLGAMRYGQPALNEALNKIKTIGYKELVILPLLPQYASSTTGSIIELVENHIQKWDSKPNTKIISSFYNHPEFINAFSQQILSYKPESYDHVVFSYHGLPNRQIRKTHPTVEIENCTCINTMPEHGTNCYKACCYETTRSLVKKAELEDNKITTSFQSRLSKNWLTPFTDNTLKELIKEGKNNVLIIAPAFVADSLETTIELGVEYKQMFIKNGGRNLTLVDSLNANDYWIKAIINIISE